MTKRVFRLLGLLLLLGALATFAYEAIGSIRAGYWQSYPLGQFWYSLSPGSLNLTQAITERYLDWRLWDYGIGRLVIWPLWVTLLPLGLLFLWLSRRSS